VNRALSVSLKAIALVALALPVSVVTTFLLSPFWSWLEASTGIESIGHSGPADWCYLAVLLFDPGSCRAGDVAAAPGAWGPGPFPADRPARVGAAARWNQGSGRAVGPARVEHRVGEAVVAKPAKLKARPSNWMPSDAITTCSDSVGGTQTGAGAGSPPSFPSFAPGRVRRACARASPICS
jgi:hypothetical protein